MEKAFALYNGEYGETTQVIIQEVDLNEAWVMFKDGDEKWVMKNNLDPINEEAEKILSG